MREVLKVGDVVSTDHKIYVLDVVEEHTSREYEETSVPGRNGNLKFDIGKYKNVNVQYRCVANNAPPMVIDAVDAALNVQIGYQRIESTLHPEYFRKGIYEGALEPQFAKTKTGATFDLDFNCMPQKFLKTGEKEQTFTASGIIVNPTRYAAAPLLEVSGNGTISFGGVTITVSSNTTQLMIDCEIGDAFSKSAHTNLNDKIRLSSNDFPRLAGGKNNIAISGISSLIITPRWWTL